MIALGGAFTVAKLSDGFDVTLGMVGAARDDVSGDEFSEMDGVVVSGDDCAAGPG